MVLGLGVVPGERSLFHENERNYQERFHRSEKKNEHIEHVFKNIEKIINRTNERILLEKSIKMRNAFLLLGTRSKSGKNFGFPPLVTLCLPPKKPFFEKILYILYKLYIPDMSTRGCCC